MKKIAKYLGLAAIIAVMLFTLTACADNDAPAPPAPANPSPPSAAPAEPTPTTPPADSDPAPQSGLFEGVGFSMEIASGWTAQVLQELGGIEVLVAPSGVSNINVVSESMQGLSLDDYADATLDMLEVIMPGFDLLLGDDMVVNGRDAVIFVYATDLPGVMTTYQIIVDGGETVFIITYTRMDDTDYSYDFLDMVNTFTVR